MGVFQGLDKAIFGHLVGGSLDHHHFFFVADVDQIQSRVEHLLVGRVDHELSVHFSEAYAAYGTVPRNVGNHKGGGSAVHHQDVGFVYLVRGKQESDYLYFIQESLREKWSQGTVA